MEHLWGCTRGWAGKNPGGNYCLLHWPRGLCCSSVCIHCSPAAQNAALGHCCSPVHPPAAALLCLMLSWVTAAALCAPTAALLHLTLPLVIAAALCIHLLQLWCTKHCPWSLLQLFACTHCTAGAPNTALGHCCSPVCAPTAALCVHPLQP